jgi:hypothetical protein
MTAAKRGRTERLQIIVDAGELGFRSPEFLKALGGPQ